MVRDRIVADNEIGWGSRAVESIDVDESMDGTVVLRIQRLRDLERDSLLSWATAAALYGTVNEAGLTKRVTTLGGTVTESLKLMDGMALVSRIVKSAS